MSKKTLYVSDLDGTLLSSKQKLSTFSTETINSLINQGMIFSYATARSYITASKVTQGISPQIPVIVYNGAFVLKNDGKEILLANYFEKAASSEILNVLLSNEIYPIVYSYINGIEKFSFCLDQATVGMASFLANRKGDIRSNPTDLEHLGEGEIFYITCIDTPEKLFPIYNLLRDKFRCVYQKDIYSGEQWLEIMPSNATKANAILQLKELLNCDKVVCFGDAKNDISMFEISDECYAVANADEELKKLAKAIIEDNDSDGVAKWLQEHFGSDASAND